MMLEEETRTTKDIANQQQQHQQQEQPEAVTAAVAVKTLGIAPMLDVTNREFRQLMRILSKRCILWTEMVVDETLIYTNDLDQHLGYDRTTSHPIVCQLGGNRPELMIPAVHKVMKYGYDEININMDCPSQRVADERLFGAALMKHIAMAQRVVQAMKEASSSLSANGRTTMTTPPPLLSVKCRIGVDELDHLDYMKQFITALKPYVQIFYLHARKCILGGLLTPKENRAVPPLNYPRVYELCRLFPDCDFYLNGGIPDLKSAKDLCFGRQEQQGQSNVFTSTEDTTTKFPMVSSSSSSGNNGKNEASVLHHVVPCSICQLPNGSCVAVASPEPPPNLRGCLMGRGPRDNPCMLWDADRYFYGEPSNPCQNRRQVLDQYMAYLETQVPRRCCDSDSRPTRRLPCGFAIVLEYDCCVHCDEFCFMTNNNRQETLNTTTTVAPTNYVASKMDKISSHVLNHCIRPIMGLFHDIPKAKAFRRECDRLIQHEKSWRNCGPATLLRRAIRVVPDQVLEQPFVSTEELEKEQLDGRGRGGNNRNSSNIDCCRGTRRW